MFFKRSKNIELSLTITTRDTSIKNVFEHFLPSPEERVDALKMLKGSDFRICCFVAPSVDLLMFEDLNMSGVRQNISNTVRNNLPDLEDKYKNLYKLSG